MKGILSFFRKLMERWKKKMEKRRYQRLAWYIYKFASSCGAFKEYPNQENLERLKETANQIAERLGIELNNVLNIAEEYLRNPSKDLKIQFNDKATEFILSMILSRG
jgi:aspartate/glutamate racemase